MSVALPIQKKLESKIQKGKVRLDDGSDAVVQFAFHSDCELSKREGGVLKLIQNLSPKTTTEELNCVARAVLTAGDFSTLLTTSKLLTLKIGPKVGELETTEKKVAGKRTAAEQEAEMNKRRTALALQRQQSPQPTDNDLIQQKIREATLVARTLSIVGQLGQSASELNELIGFRARAAATEKPLTLQVFSVLAPFIGYFVSIDAGLVYERSGLGIFISVESIESADENEESARCVCFTPVLQTAADINEAPMFRRFLAETSWSGVVIRELPSDVGDTYVAYADMYSEAEALIKAAGADWLSIDLKLSLRGDVDGVRPSTYSRDIHPQLRTLNVQHTILSSDIGDSKYSQEIQQAQEAAALAGTPRARLLGALEAVAEGSQAWPTGEQGRTEVIDLLQAAFKRFPSVKILAETLALNSSQQYTVIDKRRYATKHEDKDGDDYSVFVAGIAADKQQFIDAILPRQLFALAIGNVNVLGVDDDEEASWLIATTGRSLQFTVPAVPTVANPSSNRVITLRLLPQKPIVDLTTFEDPDADVDDKPAKKPRRVELERVPTPRPTEEVTPLVMSSGITTESRNEPLSLEDAIKLRRSTGQITLPNGKHVVLPLNTAVSNNDVELTEMPADQITGRVISHVFKQGVDVDQAGIAAMKAQIILRNAVVQQNIEELRVRGLKILVRDLWSVATFDMKTFAPKFPLAIILHLVGKTETEDEYIEMPMGDKWNEEAEKDFHATIEDQFDKYPESTSLAVRIDYAPLDIKEFVIFEAQHLFGTRLFKSKYVDDVDNTVYIGANQVNSVEPKLVALVDQYPFIQYEHLRIAFTTQFGVRPPLFPVFEEVIVGKKKKTLRYTSMRRFQEASRFDGFVNLKTSLVGHPWNVKITDNDDEEDILTTVFVNDAKLEEANTKLVLRGYNRRKIFDKWVERLRDQSNGTKMGTGFVSLFGILKGFMVQYKLAKIVLLPRLVSRRNLELNITEYTVENFLSGPQGIFAQAVEAVRAYVIKTALPKSPTSVIDLDVINIDDDNMPVEAGPEEQQLNKMLEDTAAVVVAKSPSKKTTKKKAKAETPDEKKANTRIAVRQAETQLIAPPTAVNISDHNLVLRGKKGDVTKFRERLPSEEGTFVGAVFLHLAYPFIGSRDKNPRLKLVLDQQSKLYPRLMPRRIASASRNTEEQRAAAVKRINATMKRRRQEFEARFKAIQQADKIELAKFAIGSEAYVKKKKENSDKWDSLVKAEDESADAAEEALYIEEGISRSMIDDVEQKEKEVDNLEALGEETTEEIEDFDVDGDIALDESEVEEFASSDFIFDGVYYTSALQAILAIFTEETEAKVATLGSKAKTLVDKVRVVRAALFSVGDNELDVVNRFASALESSGIQVKIQNEALADQRFIDRCSRMQRQRVLQNEALYTSLRQALVKAESISNQLYLELEPSTGKGLNDEDELFQAASVDEKSALTQRSAAYKSIDNVMKKLTTKHKKPMFYQTQKQNAPVLTYSASRIRLDGSNLNAKNVAFVAGQFALVEQLFGRQRIESKKDELKDILNVLSGVAKQTPEQATLQQSAAVADVATTNILLGNEDDGDEEEDNDSDEMKQEVSPTTTTTTIKKKKPAKKFTLVQLALDSAEVLYENLHTSFDVVVVAKDSPDNATVYQSAMIGSLVDSNDGESHRYIVLAIAALPSTTQYNNKKSIEMLIEYAEYIVEHTDFRSTTGRRTSRPVGVSFSVAWLYEDSQGTEVIRMLRERGYTTETYREKEYLTLPVESFNATRQNLTAYNMYGRFFTDWVADDVDMTRREWRAEDEQAESKRYRKIGEFEEESAPGEAAAVTKVPVRLWREVPLPFFVPTASERSMYQKRLESSLLAQSVEVRSYFVVSCRLVGRYPQADGRLSSDVKGTKLLYQTPQAPDWITLNGEVALLPFTTVIADELRVNAPDIEPILLPNLKIGARLAYFKKKEVEIAQEVLEKFEDKIEAAAKKAGTDLEIAQNEPEAVQQRKQLQKNIKIADRAYQEYLRDVAATFNNAQYRVDNALQTSFDFQKFIDWHINHLLLGEAIVRITGPRIGTAPEAVVSVNNEKYSAIVNRWADADRWKDEKAIETMRPNAVYAPDETYRGVLAERVLTMQELDKKLWENFLGAYKAPLPFTQLDSMLVFAVDSERPEANTANRFVLTVEEVTFVGTEELAPRTVFRSRELTVEELRNPDIAISSRLRMKSSFNKETNKLDVDMTTDYTLKGSEFKVSDGEDPSGFIARQVELGNTMTSQELAASPPTTITAFNKFQVTVPQLNAVDKLTFEFADDVELVENQPERIAIGAFYIHAASNGAIHSVRKLTKEETRVQTERDDMKKQKQQLRKQAEQREQSTTSTDGGSGSGSGVLGATGGVDDDESDDESFEQDESDSESDEEEGDDEGEGEGAE